MPVSSLPPNLKSLNPNPHSHPHFEDPLKVYWTERAKLIKHLENRNKKFLKKSKADLDKAKGIKRPKAPKPLQIVTTPSPGSTDTSASSSASSVVTSEYSGSTGTGRSDTSGKSSNTSENTMIAKNVVNVAKRVVAVSHALNSEAQY
jgi:hypothetical protein